MNIQEIDRKLKQLAKNYLNLEKEILDLIIEMDRSKGFYKLGHNSLYSYVTEALKFSPAVAYNFINVARKAIEVPELKVQVKSGELSISKAQKMTSVLTKENHKKWFELARTKTHRELEKEVSIASPKTAIKEKAKYIPMDQQCSEKVTIKREIPRLKLELGVSEQLMLKIRRAQDLESQRKRQNLDLENTLEEVLNLYLERRDPVRKAKRQKAKGKLRPGNMANRPVQSHLLKKDLNRPSHDQGLSKSQDRKCRSIDKNSSREELPKRKPIPSAIIHQVQLRDQGRCTHRDKKGKRCTSKRYLEIHHIEPVSQGGGNDLENLKLLCSGHHKVEHKQINTF